MKRIIYMIGIVLVLVFFFFISIIYIDNKKKTVPYDYYMFIRNEQNNIIHTTYVYKVKMKKKNQYKYIYTEVKVYGSEEQKSEEEIIEKGKLIEKSELNEILKKNNSIGNVKFKGKTKIYTYEEFLNLKW